MAANGDSLCWQSLHSAQKQIPNNRDSLGIPLLTHFLEVSVVFSILGDLDCIRYSIQISMIAVAVSYV